MKNLFILGHWIEKKKQLQNFTEQWETAMSK